MYGKLVENKQHGLGIDPVTATFIIAGFNTGLGLLLNRKSGMQKEEASRIVDEAETHFQRLLVEWESLPNRTEGDKQRYLNTVLQGMDQVKRFLLNPELGDHGQRGLMERLGTYDPITGNGIRGSRWDWWGYYWDPIKNTVVEPSPVSQIPGTVGIDNGLGQINWVLWGGIGLGLYFFMKRS